MKFIIDKNALKGKINNSARRCGYVLQYSESNRFSFVRRLSSLDFPRFHLYAEENENKYFFSLHLDQKKPVYKGGASHQGEYEGSLVENEFKRIKNIFL